MLQDIIHLILEDVRSEIRRMNRFVLHSQQWALTPICSKMYCLACALSGLALGYAILFWRMDA